jgi:predicted Zn-dependent peptidase
MTTPVIAPFSPTASRCSLRSGRSKDQRSDEQSGHHEGDDHLPARPTPIRAALRNRQGVAHVDLRDGDHRVRIGPQMTVTAQPSSPAPPQCGCSRPRPMTTTYATTDTDTTLHTLPNGVRVVAITLPQLDSAQVSVFVRTGSQHESTALNGISHMVEHMAFKGTHERDCQRINLDAESLGAEVNAHTDKDHSAFHMYGRAADATRFVEMLGDIVLHSSFPRDELERERQVILHELVEDEDDPMSTAFKLFDRACFGTHPLGQSVIGTRHNIKRFTREELLDYTRRQYTGANIVVGVAGAVDAQAVVRQVQRSFGELHRGSENRVPAPAYGGGIVSRRLAGCPQSHLVLGFPIAPLGGEHHAAVVAAALFGEGMSSPLMDQLRERSALVYYAACSADVMELSGQFVIEASTAPQNVDEFFVQVMRLLRAQADAVDATALQRARHQIAVRRLRTQEQPARRLEAAAMDLFCLGRVRPRTELAERIDTVSAEQVREAFRALLGASATVAMTGKLPSGANARVRALVAPRPA